MVGRVPVTGFRTSNHVRDLVMLTMSKRRSGFSLIELVVVIVILGIIATIALPRIGSTATGAAESGLRQDLAVMRSAIETYKAEHQGNPPAIANMPEALTERTDVDGTLNASGIYGPYLSSIPPLKVGDEAGETAIAGSAATGVAWVYDETAGEIEANASGADASGVNYADY